MRGAVQSRSRVDIYGESGRSLAQTRTDPLESQGDESNRLSDFKAARMEKQTDEHGVIDDAFADRGSVRLIPYLPSVPLLTRDSIAGIHRLLDPRRRPLPPLCQQAQEPADQKLPRSRQTRRCDRRSRRLHRIHRFSTSREQQRSIGSAPFDEVADEWRTDRGRDGASPMDGRQGSSTRARTSANIGSPSSQLAWHRFDPSTEGTYSSRTLHPSLLRRSTPHSPSPLSSCQSRSYQRAERVRRSRLCLLLRRRRPQLLRSHSST